MGVAILDTETTGANSKLDEPVSIAYIPITGAGLNPEQNPIIGDVWHSYFDTVRALHPEAQKIHGISKAQVKGLPKYRDVGIASLKLPIGTKYIICHNAPFDRGILKNPTTVEFLCTLKAVKALIMDDPEDLSVTRTATGRRSYALTSLIKDLFPEQGAKLVEGAHGAVKDCQLTLLLLQYLFKNFEIADWEDFAEIAKIS